MTRETIRNFAILSVLVLIQFSCATEKADHASISFKEPSSSRMYPLITTKERLAIWDKARGLWKGRVPEPIRELKEMRSSWAKKRQSLD